jgi:hypothetical protein
VAKSVNSPFATCANGHDLKVERAYIFDNLGKSSCRACAMAKVKPKRLPRKKGSFV